MSRPDLALRRPAAGWAFALLAAAWLAGTALAAQAPAETTAPATADTAEPAAPAAAGPGAEAGRALLERYRVEPLSDSVLLRPRVEGSAVRSIELTEEGEVLVNGKQFERDEVEAFLGEDGRRVAELASLDFDATRAALGIAIAPEVDEDEEAIAVPGVPPVPPVPPVPGDHRRRSSRDDRVSFGHSIHLREGESAHEVVCIGCSVEIDGETFGNVVAVGGSLQIDGVVHGDAVAVGGSMDVGEGAVVEGDGVAVGGKIEVAEGGRIEGERSSIGIGGPVFGWRDGWRPFGIFGDASRLLAAIFRAGLLALLGVLTFLLLRPAAVNAGRRVAEEPWKALFAGLLTQLLFFPVLVLVTVVLAVSIVGIPLLVLVPVALLAFVIAALVGFVGVCRWLGQWVETRTQGRFSSEVLAVVVGILLVQAVALIGRALSLPGGVFAIIGFTIVGLGFFLKYVVWTLGMGAMTLAAFGRDWRRAPRPPAGDELALEPPPPPPAEPRPDALP